MPIIGPIIILVKEEAIALLSEKTFNLVRAIPKDIKIKNIVAYISHSVVFIINFGRSWLKYNIKAENNIA